MNHSVSQSPGFAFAVDVAEKQVLAATEARIVAELIVSHEAVRRWLKSWAMPQELSEPGE